MKVHYKSLFIVAVFIATAMSCKLDNGGLPIAPPSAYTNDEATVLGMIVNGKVLDDAYLTAAWKTTSTTQQYYDTSRIVLYGVGIANKFDGVKLDEKTKTYKYLALNSSVGVTGDYWLFTDQNILYLKVPSNPFFDQSANSLVRITRLTNTNMTWLAIDTNVIRYNGKPARLAYQVTFARQP